MNNTTKRTALVTGANKGIGLETARQLADAGYVVWIGSRDLDRGRAAAEALSAHGEVRVVALDVTDEDSVRSAAAEIGAAHGSLDVLVNNAAVARVEGEGPPSAVDLETVREDIEVNLFGPLRVTQAFLPLVKKSPEGRIVNVSTKMASLSPLADPESIQRAAQKAFPIFAYPVSKTALNSLTGWLAAELADTPIKVNSVCPGVNKTDMNSDPSGSHPSEGAKVAVRAAMLGADGPTGSFFDIDGPAPW
ncbi:MULTISPECIES: SDR family oxidoreductase [Streptomyces]|uniref:SDR family oxidoreductase n=1 Tax=Streptomyces TaxID=1883 RepID=UPI0003A68FE4|nr:MULTISPECIES: SDR family oxidoreductase [Streptomyces]MBZ6112457.1 SDR family oxidoreductase [Streptomyces olivaceus]MBZ6125982.1 SDR family oxidoreductase [Streptomyces olivaceus]MBZ6147084.1 SDR family oxidoreductase [Streptomyces olivaceus]MBZ6160834.1 SDR family oxidoreductase [Streptomyces olivaceus]MBZ6187925.1 SDR family oxidoreductase [Streptomyces olivaceus]